MTTIELQNYLTEHVRTKSPGAYVLEGMLGQWYLTVRDRPRGRLDRAERMRTKCIGRTYREAAINLNRRFGLNLDVAKGEVGCCEN